MKNTKYKIGFILLILSVFLFFFINPAEGAMMVPSFDLHIVVNANDGDAEFNYTLKTNTSGNPVPKDSQDFSIQTTDGIGDVFISTFNIVDGDHVYLKQESNTEWVMLRPNCVSDNLDIKVEQIDDGIKITAYPFNSITCTFTNNKKRTPVIIIPGILSSYLNRNDNIKTELWPNIWTALFGWPGDKYLDELSMDLIGQSNRAYPNVLATDIFRKVGSKDFFDGLIKKLEEAGYDEGKNLFVFPYDWRRDIREIKLDEKISQILEETGSEKVNLIAHSMGGLIAKYYIKNNGTSTVDKFIDIATPHLGAPAAIKTLLFGDDMGIKFGIFGMNSDEVKKIAQNMPSLYQLLPSRSYFSLAGQATSSPDYKYYLYDMDDVDKDGIRGRLDFDQTNQFLKNTGRNSVILDIAPKIHNDLDLMNPADYGAKTYNIVGCGVPTIGKFFTLGYKNSSGQYYDISYISGDGTVPEKSARSFPVDQEYQIAGVNHSTLPSSFDVSNLIADILTGLTPALSTSTKNCKLPDGDLLSFHGPVQVNIYDQKDNHTGPILGSGYEQTVPDIFYDFIEDNTFIYLPLVSEYKVKVSSKKKGKVSSHIKKIIDEKIVSTSYFNDIPLASASTTLEINLMNSDNPPEIILYPDGNNEEVGTENQVIQPSVTIDGDSLEDQSSPVTSVSVEPQATSTVVSFDSDDEDILVTEYSIDNGENYNVASSTSPLIITEVGTTTIIYQSTDIAGNIENPKQAEVYISPTSTSTFPISEYIATSTPATSNVEDDIASTAETSNEVISNKGRITSGGTRHKNRSSDQEYVLTEENNLGIISPEIISLDKVVKLAEAKYLEKVNVSINNNENTNLEKNSSSTNKVKEKENKGNIYYASVLSLDSVRDKNYWWIIVLLIIFITIAISFIKRRKKE